MAKKGVRSRGETGSLAIIYPPLSDIDCLSDIGLPAWNEGIMSFTKNKKHKMLVGFKKIFIGNHLPLNLFANLIPSVN